ncbi:MAG: DUF998 domain-containing protein [Thermoplasmata archaeon]|nr:DUF998 domain-containing protein [Thermoplasmata archaeon]
MFAFGSLQFVVAMIYVQTQYLGGYSDVANQISDLGNFHNSPAYRVFNGSIILLGLLGLLGTLLVRSAFARRRSSRIGLTILAIANLGAIGVGLFPETATQLGGHVHGLVSLVTFLGSAFALVFLAIAMVRDTRWEGFRGYTGLSGLVTLFALIAFLAIEYNSSGAGLGDAGLVERIIAAPILLWGIVAGLHLVRLPTYSPGRFGSRPAS